MLWWNDELVLLFFMVDESCYQISLEIFSAAGSLLEIKLVLVFTCVMFYIYLKLFSHLLNLIMYLKWNDCHDCLNALLIVVLLDMALLACISYFLFVVNCDLAFISLLFLIWFFSAFVWTRGFLKTSTYNAQQLLPLILLWFII